MYGCCGLVFISVLMFLPNELDNVSKMLESGIKNFVNQSLDILLYFLEPVAWLSSLPQHLLCLVAVAHSFYTILNMLHLNML